MKTSTSISAYIFFISFAAELLALLCPYAAYAQDPPTVTDVEVVRGADPDLMFPTKIILCLAFNDNLPTEGFALFLHAVNANNPPTLFTIDVGDISESTGISASGLWLCTTEQNIPMDTTKVLKVYLDSLITFAGETIKFSGDSKWKFDNSGIYEDVTVNQGTGNGDFTPTNNDNAKVSGAYMFLDESGTIVSTAVMWQGLNQALTGAQLKLEYVIQSNGNNITTKDIVGQSLDQIGSNTLYFPRSMSISPSQYNNDLSTITITNLQILQLPKKNILSSADNVPITFVRVN